MNETQIPEAGKKITILLIPDTSYSESLTGVVRYVTEKTERLCYVSLNKPYSSLRESFRNQSIRTERIFFIDAASKKSGTSDDKEPVVFVSSPRALTEMGITIKKIIDAARIESIIFDSISTLLVYEKPPTILKFVHSMTSEFRSKNISSFFTLVKDKASEEMLKDLNMFADEVIDFGKGSDDPYSSDR